MKFAGKLAAIITSVSLLVGIFGVAAQAKEIQIKDVPKTDEAYEQIQWVLNQGFMSLSISKFLPASNVRRDEFAAILAKLNGDVKNLSNPSTPTYKDVNPKDQFYKYIESEKGYMTYTKNTKGSFFKPLVFLTREDAALSIVKILGYDSDEATAENVDSDVSLDSVIQDADKVSPILQKYVALAVQNQLIDIRQDGDNNYFDPKKNITRKQLAVFIYNAMQSRNLGMSGDDTMALQDSSSTSTQKSTTDVTGTTQSPVVKDISLSLSKTSIVANERTKATATVTMEPVKASAPKVVFSSSNSAVAMIDSNGNIMGLGSGTTYITVSAGGQESKALLTVGVDSKVSKVSIGLDKPNLAVGDLVKANIQVVMQPADAPKPAVSVTASNPNIVFVGNDGQIKALAAGTTDIILTCGDKTSKISITVSNPAVGASVPVAANIGNTAGNLANKGRFAQGGNYIFYSNKKDDEKFYRMTVDGSENIKLNDDKPYYISVVGDTIYYINYSDQNKIYTVKTDGSSKDVVTDDKADAMVVAGDSIYYTNYGNNDYLFRIKLDGSEKTMIKKDDEQFRAAYPTATDGYVFVAGNYGGIYRYDIQQNKVEQINANGGDYLQYDNGWLYFLESGLYKMKPDGTKKIKLVDNYPKCVNVYGDYIYYVDGDDHLRKIKTDGSNNSIVNDKINVYTYYNIYCANNGIYYYDDTQDKFMVVPVDGSSDPVPMK